MKKSHESCPPSTGKWRKLVLIMKLKLFILCIALQASAETFSQVPKLDVSFNNTPMEMVLEQLQEQSGCQFFYLKKNLSTAVPVTLEMKDATLNEVLDKVLKAQGYDYEIRDNIVSILAERLPQAQEKVRVTGIVKDLKGNTLPGAAVIIKGTQVGVATDADGKFAIAVEPGNDVTLVFSFIGYKSKEVKVGDSETLEVHLEADVKDLEEVMVTGYQTISKERATGSFDIIDKKHLQQPAVNIAERLVGMAAGVQLLPGTTESFEIRGKTSLGANTSPLLVVDGFPVQTGFSSINPNDVESVTILKDAASASIWGARSANGVIVVTTKRGAKFSPKGATVSVSAVVRVSPKIDYDYWRPYASSAETVEYEKMLFENNAWGQSYPNEDDWRYVTSSRSQAMTALNEHYLGFLNDEELEDILNQLKNQDNKQQIKDYILEIPLTQQYNINISGSTNRMSNNFSLMYARSRGNMQGPVSNNLLANYQSDIRLFRWLDFSFSGMLQYTKSSGVSANVPVMPYDMLVDENGNRTDMNYYSYYVPILKRHFPLDSFPYTDWSYNYLTEAENTERDGKSWNARVQGGFTFHLLKGLDFDTRFQYELSTSNTINLYNEKTFYVRNQVNTTSYWDREANTVTPNLPTGGIRTESKSETASYHFRNQLTFNRTFAERHAFNVVAGVEISDQTSESTDYPTTYGYDDESLTVGVFPNGITGTKNWMGYTNSSSLFDYTSSYSSATDRYFSAFANAAYTFDDKYSVSVSARTDASNLITDDPQYRYAPFWSVGGSWQIGKEKFMEPAAWIDRLNVRLTYGHNGNVDKSTSFRPLIDVETQQDEWLNDYIADIASYGNPTLRWERTGTWNVGLDYSVLQGKLHGKFDVYNKRGKDLIAEVSIPQVNGTTTQAINAAKMTNRGFELEIGTHLPILGEDIAWTGNFNFAYNKNRIRDLNVASRSATLMTAGGRYAYVEGYDANTIWSLEYVGMRNLGTEESPDWQPCIANGDEAPVSLSQYTSGDGIDVVVNSGTSVAPVNMGFSNSFKIYDFDVSFLLLGKFGHHFRRTGFNYPTAEVPNKYYSEVVNGDPNEIVPLPSDTETLFYRWGSKLPDLDYLVESAALIRLQEVSVAYNMPLNWVSKLGLSTLQLSVQGSNLATWVKNDYKEDPEYKLGSMKPRPTCTFSLRLTF